MPRKYQSKKRKGAERGPYKSDDDHLVSLTVRISAEEKKRLEDLAESTGVSVSHIIRSILDSQSN